MDGHHETSNRLDRVERKLDRLLQIGVVVLVCQPILLVSFLMPGVVLQLVCYGLLTCLVVLAAFPNLETKLPETMRWMGGLAGRLRRRMQGFALR